MIAIDLFSGAGGMALGAKNAGVNVLLAVEKDPNAAQTYRLNHPDIKILNTDIRCITKSDLIDTKEFKILFGGPPCQGFSTSNQRTRSIQNPDNWLFKEFIRILSIWQPDVIIIENVKGIFETKKGKFFQEILKNLKVNNYSTKWWVLDAMHYGIPQKRKRLFILGSRHNINFKDPEKHFNQITVKEAISDLPELENGANFNRLPYKSDPQSLYARKMRGTLTSSTNHLVTKNNDVVIERYQHVPQGGNWQNIPDILMGNYKNKFRCHTGIYRRLREDQPSVVLGNYRKNMLIHPYQHRGLSVREAARLQSFPDWYEFFGSIGFQQQQVGNAVPPLLSEILFRTIIQQI